MFIYVDPTKLVLSTENDQERLALTVLASHVKLGLPPLPMPPEGSTGPHNAPAGSFENPYQLSATTAPHRTLPNNHLLVLHSSST